MEGQGRESPRNQNDHRDSEINARACWYITYVRKHLLEGSRWLAVSCNLFVLCLSFSSVLPLARSLWHKGCPPIRAHAKAEDPGTMSTTSRILCHPEIPSRPFRGFL